MNRITILFISSGSITILLLSVFIPVYLFTPYKSPAYVTSLLINSVEEKVDNYNHYYSCELNVSLIFPNSCSAFSEYSLKTDNNGKLVIIKIIAWHTPRNSVCLATASEYTLIIQFVVNFRNWTIWCNGLETELLMYHS